jgi:hypothetical protein
MKEHHDSQDVYRLELKDGGQLNYLADHITDNTILYSYCPYLPSGQPVRSPAPREMKKAPIPFSTSDARHGDKR